MKQLLQSLKTGEIVLEDIPCPINNSGSLLIETNKSLVSIGTERMLLSFGKAGILGKIRQQPEKAKMALEKIKTDGFLSTMDAVKSKLEQPIPLGYCNVGKIVQIGDNVSGFRLGERVVSNGYHAEIVRVNKNLCAKVPDNVSDDDAAFTVLAAIALQGIRLSKPTLGEYYVVLGLGIIGLLTIQLLKANGCHVLGVDINASRCELAKQFSDEVFNLKKDGDLVSFASMFSQGKGIDAVLIAASTKSSDPLYQAAKMCRKRGRIVLIGVVGCEFSRADFYEKELSFQVSCSYGPGRYDKNYEEKGQDYPIAYVRWTEQRNFDAVLSMMSAGKINVKPLISHNFNIEEFQHAYKFLTEYESVLGVLFSYSSPPKNIKLSSSISVNHTSNFIDNDLLNVGFIGAGHYVAKTLAPAFKTAKVNLKNIISSQGVNGKYLAKKFMFNDTSTDENEIYTNKDIHVAVIATRHNLHAKQVVKGLDSGKHLFVEKPLAIRLEELDAIQSAYENSRGQLLMVGFNRRFAPQIQIMNNLLKNVRSPKSVIMTVNAGSVPMDHWIQNPLVGGGRIVGEVCHFIDLLRYIVGSQIISWKAVSIKASDYFFTDRSTITLTFSDGSWGVINYLANGHRSFPKERLEVFCDGKILQLNNFRKLIGFGWDKFKSHKLYRQNKGNKECVAAFVNAVKNKTSSPISFSEIMEVSKISIEIENFLRK